MVKGGMVVRCLRPAILILLLTAILTGCSLSSPYQQTAVWAGTAAEALQYARSKVGGPYVYRAGGPWQFDCSGLVVWAYRQAYPSLKLTDGRRAIDDASAAALWQYNVRHLAPQELRSGDLVFFTAGSGVSHVGLFVQRLDTDTIEIVNASSYLGRVAEEPWPLSGEHRNLSIVGFGRLLTVVSTD